MCRENMNLFSCYLVITGVVDAHWVFSLLFFQEINSWECWHWPVVLTASSSHECQHYFPFNLFFWCFNKNSFLGTVKRNSDVSNGPLAFKLKLFSLQGNLIASPYILKRGTRNQLFLVYGPISKLENDCHTHGSEVSSILCGSAKWVNLDYLN